VTDIAFYHLERSTLDQVLPKLLEKTLVAEKRALVLSGSNDKVDALNTLLWTYQPESWMPHGTANDKIAETDLKTMPVWLSVDDTNVNDAEFLFLTDGAGSRHLSTFERCFDLFDGNDQAVVNKARVRWKRYLDDGHNLTYWQQDANGSWQKKQ